MLTIIFNFTVFALASITFAVAGAWWLLAVTVPAGLLSLYTGFALRRENEEQNG